MNIKKLMKQIITLVRPAKTWSILFLMFGATTAWAEIPRSIVVQGRATTPLTTLSGTATIIPAGVSQPFTADTDANGVFQFNLIHLSPEAFADPNSLLSLQIGTTTISIPFGSVPFAFRSAQADSLSVGAPVQFVTINVTTITATAINVTTISATNIIASSATINTLRAPDGIIVGKGTILMGQTDGGALNTITFSAPPGPAIGTVNTDDSNIAGPNNGAVPLTLNAGNTGIVRLNPDSTGGVGIGLPEVGPAALTVPVSRLHVRTGDAVAATVTPILTLDHNIPGAAVGAAGIGAGLLLRAENDFDEIENAAQISGILTTVTDGTEEGALAFLTRDTVGITEKARIDSVGNLGIGTIVPAARLDVEGNAQFGVGGTKSIFTATGNLLVPGNVGIGISSPDTALHVVGSVRIVDTTQGAGKVLTSDANGIASWQSPAAAALPTGTIGQTLRHDGSDWIANSILYNDGANVGIGTTGPNDALHVYRDYDSAGSTGDNAATIFIDGATGKDSWLGWGTAGVAKVVAGIDNDSNSVQFWGYNAGWNLGLVQAITGNVGIGTTAPVTKLHVVGDTNISDNLTVGGKINGVRMVSGYVTEINRGGLSFFEISLDSLGIPGKLRGVAISMEMWRRERGDYFWGTFASIGAVETRKVWGYLYYIDSYGVHTGYYSPTYVQRVYYVLTVED
ncbi:MAG: hypothetical protein HY746_05095 [Elusimicrobia bacterium]|nr:hypothetical protein [Elusimicrobiota bacterium]